MYHQKCCFKIGTKAFSGMTDKQTPPIPLEAQTSQDMALKTNLDYKINRYVLYVRKSPSNFMQVQKLAFFFSSSRLI